ncbi:Mur ligase family protein [Clostridium sp. DJ247]|uniref:Mur ligase family protein n=1 Tax=Clostridium sp. DJ247 TaxID=2726188 RepID=UPI001627B1CB|nr:Mur ligase family protein [Clostridium sp. DJ247]MBC2581628.1 hypothetical protein [Clostridium sp. DJ247]
MESTLLSNLSHNVIKINNLSSKKSNIIGIAGSNTNTSATYLVKELLRYLGLKAQIEDTIENIPLQELSPTSLYYHRLKAYNFDMIIFTDIPEYFCSNLYDSEINKKRLSELFNIYGIGIVNGDNLGFQEIKKLANFHIITYGITTSCDFMAKEIRYCQKGIKFNLDFHNSQKEVTLNTFEKAHVYNALASISTCYFLGYPLSLIIEGLNHVKRFK